MGVAIVFSFTLANERNAGYEYDYVFDWTILKYQQHMGTSSQNPEGNPEGKPQPVPEKQ